LKNNGCQSGDALILTKALGVGLIMSALRAGVVKDGEYAAATAGMTRLNRYAAEKLENFQVSACTDITGFGFMVHAAEMAGSTHTLTINFDSLPLLPGAMGYAEDFLATAAGQRNRNHITSSVAMKVPEAAKEILFDPQTSGGLLISLPAAQAQALCAEIQKDDPAAAIVGLVSEYTGHSVVIV
jgi:selenide,water dikinase